jgi:predicted DsbA family dithiol-disulfide isomerase
MCLQKVHEIDELVRIAVDNGLDERETREYLSNPSLRDRVREFVNRKQ